MQYQTDFPRDPPPMIDPTLLVALILAMIVLMAVAFAAGRASERRNRGSGAEDVPKTIHKAILRKAREAAAAPTGRVIDAAGELAAEVVRRLGPVVMLGGPAGLNLKNLMDALKGEPEKAEKKDAGHGGHGGHDDGHGGHGGHGDHDGGHGHDDEEPVGILDTTILAPKINIRTKGPIIFAAHQPDKKAKKHDDHGHGGHKDEEPKPPSYEEQIWRVRKAVTAFADHWSRGETLAELQRAQKALLETQPLPKDYGGEF